MCEPDFDFNGIQNGKMLMTRRNGKGHHSNGGNGEGGYNSKLQDCLEAIRKLPKNIQRDEVAKLIHKVDGILEEMIEAEDDSRWLTTIAPEINC